MKVPDVIFHVVIILFLFPGASFAAQRPVEKEIDWFWFFYERTSGTNVDTLVCRPFFMESDSGDKMFQASLMPLFFWRYKDERNDRVRGFFGFYESDDYSHSEKKDDYDSGFFPLYLYGSGADEKDRYLFVYPFGGNIRGKFGYDRISPWLFPGVALFFLYPPSGIFTWQTLFFSVAALIPVYTEFESRDYSGTGIFWPLIKWGKGDSRGDFRILPFYAHNYKYGWYDTYSYLLLFNYREIYLRDDTRYTFFFFPFYGEKWSDSGDISAHTILWPFFSWGYDKKSNDRSYNLPWPLVQVRDCDNPKVRSRIFFPFYGRYRYGSNETFFVTPLYFRLKKETGTYNSAYHITCIIFWYLKRDYLKEDEYYGHSWRYLKLWPLVQAEWNDRDMFSVNILSLLPFRDTMGYEKLYQPFWTLFEYRRKPDGEKHLGLLLRTYYQVWSDDFFKMKIPLIVTYESRGETVRDFSVILNSFGYERDSGGTYLKLFWIPVRIGDGLPSDDSSPVSLSCEETETYEYERYEPGVNPADTVLAERDPEGKCFIKVNVF